MKSVAAFREDVTGTADRGRIRMVFGFLVMNRVLPCPDGSYWACFAEDPSSDPTFPTDVRVMPLSAVGTPPELAKRKDFQNWAEFCARHGADGLT